MFAKKRLWVLAKLLLIICFCSACLKQTESITPLAAPKTLSEIQKEALMAVAKQAGNSELSIAARSSLETSDKDPNIFYLNIKYNIHNIDVFEVANIPNVFEMIGHTFLMKLAKLVLAVAGPRQIDLDAFDLAIPNIDLDRSVVKSIRVKRVFLQYNKELDEATDYAANFNFLDSLELTRVLSLDKVGKIEALLLSYRKIHNRCLNKCLQFDIVNDNILDLLEPHSVIKLQPSLTVASIPAVTDIRLDGSIELQIGLKLPF